jgi:putative ABC transport system permease protein
METLLSDIKYGLRLIIKNPVFSLVVVIALALGIGANTAIFSVLNAVLLKPLPYKDSERLVMMWQRFTGIGVPKDQNWTSPPEFDDVRRYQSAFSDIAAMQGASFTILVGDRPERILGQFVSPGFFKMLGVEAFRGRTFLPEEEHQGKEAVAVVSHGLWQRRFASDQGLVGRTLNMNGRPYQIIGIAPPGFRDPVQQDAEMWAALSFTNQQLTQQRGSHGLLVIGRIKPELTLEQARADMARVSERIIEGAPDYPYTKFGYRVLINPLLEESVGDIRPALMMLMGSVALVLLIACTNVANLLLVRASAREREVGIRTALGAGRGRLIRQMLTESVVLSLVGASVGIALANFGVSLLAAMAAQSFPRLAETQIDVTALTFTMVVALATGILFGLFPAFQSARVATQDVLKESSQAATAGRGRLRLRRVLVAAEVALSLLLLVGAGLLIKSFIQLQRVDPGFDPSGVLTMRMVVPAARYSQPDQVRNFYRDVLRRVSVLPGVKMVGANNGLPLSGAGGSGTTTIDNPAFPDDRGTPEADQRTVTPGYFETMGMKMVSGRMFDERDNETSQPVAIIDETMVRTFWPNEDPLGKRIKRGGRQSTQPWLTIVGVVRHVRYRTLEEPSRVQLYLPHAQAPTTGMSLAIKTDLDPRTLSNSVQREVIAVDQEQPVWAVRTMDELMATSVMRRQLIMTLLTLFAGIALMLAAVGIYGVISYWMTQRSHEIGIRVAIGANRLDVLKMVLGQSMSVVLIGVVIGLVGAVALTRVMSTLLYDVSATDAATFAMYSAVLILVSLLASYLPARRATRIDPVTMLRQQ